MKFKSSIRFYLNLLGLILTWNQAASVYLICPRDSSVINNSVHLLCLGGSMNPAYYFACFLECVASACDAILFQKLSYFAYPFSELISVCSFYDDG
jgi:hypothetical protein